MCADARRVCKRCEHELIDEKRFGNVVERITQAPEQEAHAEESLGSRVGSKAATKETGRNTEEGDLEISGTPAEHLRL